MRTAIGCILLMMILVSCNKKKYQKITSYNDQVVKFVEKSEDEMKFWSRNNFMQEYELKKQISLTKLINLQDSLNTLSPLEKDDTMRLAGIAMVDNFIQAFSIYDTVHSLLSDSIYLVEDSIKVQNLLRTNQNMFKQQAQSFISTQKRFSERYELKFIE